MKELWRKPQFRLWLAIVGAASLVLGAAYTMVQQSTRLAADDQPLAAAQTIKKELEAGSTAEDLVPAAKVDLKKESSVFIIITDDSRRALASSAVLEGKTPLPPKGVFNYTAAHKSNEITWEPKEGIRLATTILAYQSSTGGGFIITGQSLKQYEERINTYSVLALAAWLAVIAWLFVTLLLPEQLFAGMGRVKARK